MQEAGTKLVDGQQQQHLAMKLNFLKTMWGIFPQSTLLQQTCKLSMKVLMCSVKIKDALQLKNVVVVLDQALYAEAGCSDSQTLETSFE